MLKALSTHVPTAINTFSQPQHGVNCCPALADLTPFPDIVGDLFKAADLALLLRGMITRPVFGVLF
jgi:hypothetical protein